MESTQTSQIAKQLSEIALDRASDLPQVASEIEFLERIHESMKIVIIRHVIEHLEILKESYEEESKYHKKFITKDNIHGDKYNYCLSKIESIKRIINELSQ